MPNYNTWKIISSLFSLVVFKTKKKQKTKNYRGLKYFHFAKAHHKETTKDRQREVKWMNTLSNYTLTIWDCRKKYNIAALKLKGNYK